MCFVANGYIRPSPRCLWAFIVTYALVVSVRRGSNRGILASSVEGEKLLPGNVFFETSNTRNATQSDRTTASTMCFVANGYIRPSQRCLCEFVATYVLVVSIRRGSNRDIPTNSVVGENIIPRNICIYVTHHNSTTYTSCIVYIHVFWTTDYGSVGSVEFFFVCN